MFEKRHHRLAPHHVFVKRLAKNIAIAILVFALFLTVGMSGYHYLENLSWIDSFENAAMILSGMGPVDTMKTFAGKFFAGTYAIISGVVFLVMIGVVLAPLVHRFLHHFHAED